MSKFRFRLSTLQRLRESHRDEMRGKLAEAFQAEQKLVEREAAVHAEEAKLQESHRQCLQNSQTDVNQLLNAQRYAAALKGQLNTLKSQSKMLAEEIEKRRQALVEADQQVRILEKLHDRQLTQHRADAARVEAKILDEVASHTREIDF